MNRKIQTKQQAFKQMTATSKAPSSAAWLLSIGNDAPVTSTSDCTDRASMNSTALRISARWRLAAMNVFCKEGNTKVGAIGHPSQLNVFWSKGFPFYFVKLTETFIVYTSLEEKAKAMVILGKEMFWKAADNPSKKV